MPPLFSIRLSLFEGPLAKLVSLVEEGRIAVTDVPLAAVTAQFRRHVRTLPAVEGHLLANFLAALAHLLYLKSRTLLSSPAAPAEEEEQLPDDEPPPAQELNEAVEALAA